MKEMEKNIIELVDIVKEYGNKKVLEKMNLSIKKGEFLTILGPSGSGKTTILRLIGGFEKPTRGEIKLKGQDIKDLPSHKRPTKTIFQDYALFPHLSVEGNIKYGLKLLRLKKENINKNKIEKLIQLKKQWELKAKQKMEKLDIIQKQFEDILKNNLFKSIKYKKAQKWLDSSDFTYSHWENYVDIKTIRYENLYTTRKLTKKEINEKFIEILKLIGLEGYEKSNINSISGGMKQRVALARSMILKPEIILLDEPLSALDLKIRKKMQYELRNIQQKFNMTFIFVTHDQEEAMTISDRVAIMRNGIIEQIGTPQEIYDFPLNKWAASFIGESNLFETKIIDKNKIKLFNKEINISTKNFAKNEKVDVLIRPEDILIDSKGYLEGKIIKRIYQGIMWEYEIKTNKINFKVRSTKEYNLNEKYWINFLEKNIHLMRIQND